MSILFPEHDLSAAATIGPIARACGGIKLALKQMQQAGASAVQLDAAFSGIRPRELDVRARKDLAASVARAGLRISGIDLFVPRRHLLETEHQDRAATALLSAIQLAADLGKVPLSLALPVGDMPSEMTDALATSADTHSVRLAIHAEDRLEPLADWLRQFNHPLFTAAIDPAAILNQQQDPSAAVSQLGPLLGGARLSDATEHASGEWARCTLGQGDLDLLAYHVTLSMASRCSGPLVLDLRHLEAPLQALSNGIQAWQNTAPQL